jgi:hypothetical protein
LRCIGAFALKILMCSTGAIAHDIPVVNNRAAEEALVIERAARAPNSRPKAGAQLFSFISSRLGWKQNSLKVCFWNGGSAVRARVSAAADELTTGLPIKFDWIGTCPGPSSPGGAWESIPVRVSLTRDTGVVGDKDDPGAYFALIGRQQSFDHPTTVNLPLPSEPTDPMLRNKVLHEFCHVLGCLHEHQRAGCADLFDKPVVMSAFQLSEVDYSRNFEMLPPGGLYGPTAIGPLDADSVMLYSFKREMFRAGTNPKCVREPPATELSSLDRSGLARIYSTSFGQAMSLEDFSLLALQNDLLARNRREFLDGYSALLGEIETNSSLAISLRDTIASLQMQAERAEAEADGYRPASEDLELARRALALLPKE